MKKIITLFTIVALIGSANAQRFELSKKMVEDTLYKKGYVDNSFLLNNKTSGPIVMKLRVLTNTLDTAAWAITYCTYPICVEGIPYEVLCDTIKQGETNILISNVSIQPGETPKTCELKIEMFDIIDSTYRDTITYAMTGINTEDPNVKPSNVLVNPQDLNFFEMYPNPAKSVINLNSGSEMKNLKLVDLTGQIVLSVDLENTKTTSLDVQHLNRGIYVLQAFKADGEIESKRIVLE